MMLVEGIGLKPPKPHQIVLASHQMSALIAEMRRRNGKRSYQGRADGWGRGLSGTIVVPGAGSFAPHEAAVLSGGVGEFAAVSLINKRMKREVCSVDTRLLKFGDAGVDITPLGLATQIKCRKSSHGGNTLIRCITEYGRSVPMPWEALVSCEWRPGSLVCSVLGWQWKRDIVALPIVPARKGGHQNYELPDSMLLPMCSFIDELKSRT